ncbi:hypothetical protein FOA52_016292 [Chlamydomonas sp. UWO 241]|nr:hypothetical protein FOA52_016292 [Chlamydomonas sp. UWO 241]
MLDSPAVFQMHALQGGCNKTCSQKLACSHTCKLPCHPYNLSHDRIKCDEIMYSYLMCGHLISHRCSENSADIACETCMEVQKIAKDAQEKLKKLELQAMEEARSARSARKAEVGLQLERARMSKPVELQRLRGDREMKKWEAEQRAAADAEVVQMDLAERWISKEAEAAQKEAEARRRSLSAAKAQLDVLAREGNDRLQALENSKACVQAAAAEGAAALGADAVATTDYVTVAQLKDKLLAAVGSDGGDLGAITVRVKALLSDRSAVPAESLDVLFRTAGVGERLHAYCVGKVDASPTVAPPTVASGLDLMNKHDWFGALSLFKELAKLVSVPMGARTAAAAPPAASAHPAAHLADAMAMSANTQPVVGAGHGGGARVPGLSKQAEQRAHMAGNALSCLLHPAVSELPCSLAPDVLSLLRDGLASLGDYSVVAGASGARGGGASSAPPAAWAALAEKKPSFKELLDMTGLRDVKQALSNLADQVDLDNERKRPLSAKSYNTMFYGNPGTGKTTIARIYAKFLKRLATRPRPSQDRECMLMPFVETSGAKLLAGGVPKLQKCLQKLEKGGVLFIDECYQLNPKASPMGAQVLDALLPEMENRRGKQFTFADYSDAELFSIFKGLVSSDKADFRLADDAHGRMLCVRLGRGRGKVGFGNARAVRNAWETTLVQQAERVLRTRSRGEQGTASADPLLIMRDDLLGPKELNVSGSTALAELNQMRGLQAVKDQVSNLLMLICTNAELEEQGKRMKDLNLNRVFLGNPGTGKTTVALIYGSVLKDLGLLSKGDVVVKVPADFIGSVLGESEKKTAAILDTAIGCVLVIDEAYGLHSRRGVSDPYKEAVVDTIVAKVQGLPGDDRCVLLLGYEDQMEAMMREANPGLARCFQLSSAWRFADYDKTDLYHIMRGAAERTYDWSLCEDELTAGIKALEVERRRPNFGNAGSVNNLLSAVAERMEARLFTAGASVAERARAAPTADDFLPPRPVCSGGVLDDLVGCDSVLAKLEEWRAVIEMAKRTGSNPLQAMELNFRFVGSPGTGKTTIAKRVGMMFKELGLLSSSNVVQCTASDVTTGFANQSGGKARELFTKALGGVLFLDEAYRLNPRIGGPFMQEALDEIVQMLTEDMFKDKMVVILAGCNDRAAHVGQTRP